MHKSRCLSLEFTSFLSLSFLHLRWSTSPQPSTPKASCLRLPLLVRTSSQYSRSQRCHAYSVLLSGTPNQCGSATDFTGGQENYLLLGSSANMLGNEGISSAEAEDSFLLILGIPATPSSSPSSSPAGTLSLGLSTFICDLHSVVLSLVSLISNIQDFDIIKVCAIKETRAHRAHAYLGQCRCAYLHWTGDGRWWFKTFVRFWNVGSIRISPSLPC